MPRCSAPADLLQPDGGQPLLRIVFAVAENEGGARQDLQIVRMAAVFRQLALDVAIEGLALLEGAVAGIDQVGLGGGEFPPRIGVAGLGDHRRPLRHGRQGGAARDVDMLRPDGKVPLGPDPACGLEELPRPLVALGKGQMVAPPEIGAGERPGRRHHVPARPAARQDVERRQLARQRIGLVEGGRQRADQPDMAGDGGQRGQDRQGVRAAGHVEIVEAALLLAHPQAFGQEDEVEPAALHRLGEVPERGEGDLAARRRIAPDGEIVHAGELRPEDDLLLRHDLLPVCGQAAVA